MVDLEGGLADASYWVTLASGAATLEQAADAYGNVQPHTVEITTTNNTNVIVDPNNISYALTIGDLAGGLDGGATFGIDPAGNVKTYGEIIVANKDLGVVLHSPDDSPWRIVVDNSGNLSAIAI
jgi:hypothetical protein